MQMHLQPKVYTPCVLEGKWVMWEQLCQKVVGDSFPTWWACGYFNALILDMEHNGNANFSRECDINFFNEYINNFGFIDFLLNGRRSHFQYL